MVAALAGAALAQPAPEIGVAAAVNPQARGTPPAAEVRTLQVGINVIADERIVTGPAGQVQMLFLDESAFTIGPNSEVVLDEFVYDPASETGQIALSAAKGVFRLVGGKISKRTPVILNTPTATIGIRGGIALVNVAPDGATQATFLFGEEMTVGTQGGQRSVGRPGFTVSADDENAPPSEPTRATTEQLTASLGNLEGGLPADDGDGGAPGAAGGDVPTEQDVVASNLGETGSGNDPDALAPPPPPPGGDTEAGAAGTQTATQTTTQSQQNTNLTDPDTGASESPSTPTTPDEPPGLSVAGSFGGRAVGAANPEMSPGAFGLDRDEAGKDAGFTGGTISDGTFTANLGSLGTFSAPVEEGTFSVSAITNPFGSGTLSGTGELSSDNQFLLFELTGGSGGGEALVFAGIPTATLPTATRYYTIRPDAILSTNTPFIPKSAGGSIALPAQEASEPDGAILFNDSGAVPAFGAFVAGASGTGAAQGSVVSVFVGRVDSQSQSGETMLVGEFRGSSVLSQEDQPHVFYGPFSSMDDGSSSGNHFFGTNADHVVIAGNPTVDHHLGETTVESYTPANVLNSTSQGFSESSARTSRTLNGFSGSLGFRTENGVLDETPGRFVNDFSELVSISTSAETNKVEAEFRVGASGVDFELQFGDGDVDAFGSRDDSIGRSAFIDDTHFAAVDSTVSDSLISFPADVATDRLYLVSVGPEGLPGLSTQEGCDCAFLTWGLWGGEVIDDGSDDVYAFHAAPFVVGDVTHFLDLPQFGSATYAGDMMGNVFTGGAVYQATGTWQQTWDFGQQVGSFSAAFDGVSYTGNAFGDGVEFSGSGTANNPSRSMDIQGAFFSDGTNSVGGQAGNFRINESESALYRAAGVFRAACTSGTCDGTGQGGQ